MSKGTVLYIGGFELPDKNAAAQRVIGNAKILKSLGYEVVLVGVDKMLGEHIPINDTMKKYEDFTYYSISYPKRALGWINYLSSINNVLNLNTTNITHIIAYNYPGIALLRLKKYCNKNNILLIADCTEWYEPKGSLIFRMIKGFDGFLRMKIVQPKLDGIIVISDYLYKFYEPKTSCIINLPPLVDLSMDKWQNLNFELDNKKVNLVYAGSPGGTQKDRLDIVIDCLGQIKKRLNIDFCFTIIGLTLEEYNKTYALKPLSIDHENFTLFKGKLPHLSVLKEIAKSDYQIFLRDSNLTNTAGFPTKFVEAISVGTPILSNSSSNIANYMLAGKTGFMLNDSEELTNDLRQAIATDKNTIREMKQYCKNSKMFDFKNHIESFRNFLDCLELKR